MGTRGSFPGGKAAVAWNSPPVSAEFKKMYRKVPRLGQKRNAGLCYSILVAISFKIVSLVIYTAIPSFFFHASKAPWKSFSLILSSTTFVIPFGCQALLQNIITSVAFSIWETK
jgi:hypothetical protein